MFKALGVVAPCLCLAAGLYASPQDVPAPQTPTFRSNTNVVRVDVTVIDRRGNPVTSLTGDDFEVWDNGQLQAITAFKLVEANGQPPGDDVSLEIRNVQHAAAEAARDEVRVFLIFWDEYHIDPYLGAARAREDLTRAVLHAFGPTDLVAIMDPLLTLDAIRFTRDRRALAEQIRTLRGRRAIYTPPRSVIEEAHLQNIRNIERIRMQVSTSAIEAAVVHLGTLREGRKSLIIVSEGLGAPSDTLREMLRAANDSNTAVYFIDPRGLQLHGRASPFLESLTYGSGGESLVTNDIPAAFTRVVNQASAFYLLGYAMTPRMDGRFHELKVRVKRPGVDVRSRTGYWAPRAADVERAKSAAAAAELTPPLVAALSTLAPAHGAHAVDIWAGDLPRAEGAARATLAWTSRRAGDGPPGPVDVSVTATSASGQVFEGPIEPAGTSFDAPSGPLRLAFTIRDSNHEVIDRDVRILTLRDASAAGLALTTPVVFLAANALELRTMASTARPPVYAGRDFDRTDRVLICFGTHGTTGADTRITATLLNRVGAKLVDLPVQPDPIHAGYKIDLPLTSIANGEFVVSIEATSGSERAEALVPFRLR